MLCTYRLRISPPSHLLHMANDAPEDSHIVVTGTHRHQQGLLQLRYDVHEEDVETQIGYELNAGECSYNGRSAETA